MKKIISIILLIAMMVTTLSSCSSEELGLYNAFRSMQDMKSYCFSGSQTLNVIEANLLLLANAAPLNSLHCQGYIILKKQQITGRFQYCCINGKIVIICLRQR